MKIKKNIFKINKLSIISLSVLGLLSGCASHPEEPNRPTPIFIDPNRPAVYPNNPNVSPQNPTFPSNNNNNQNNSSESVGPDGLIQPNQPQMPDNVSQPSNEPPQLPEGKISKYGALRPSSWEYISGWPGDNPLKTWDAFLKSCKVLLNRNSEWNQVCQIALSTKPQSDEDVMNFFMTYFQPYQVVNQNGTTSGLITGYYEPLLRGSKVRTGKYQYPIYKTPSDLFVIDLVKLYPELKGKRLRGRLIPGTRKIIPYYSRAEIDVQNSPLAGNELVYVDDPVDVFDLHIQGSGRILFENGEMMRINYDEQNGHPWKSMARFIAQSGELPLSQTSPEGIKRWALNNPSKLQYYLNYNPSYVFFRETSGPANEGALGALNVPLTAERSIAIDPKFIPLGAPVFISFKPAFSSQPIQRLVMAQDTGGAIRGAVRADFFFGFGEEATKRAKQMHQQGNIWVILPKALRVNR